MSRGLPMNLTLRRAELHEALISIDGGLHSSPLRGSWSRCMCNRERGLPMNLPPFVVQPLGCLGDARNCGHATRTG